MLEGQLDEALLSLENLKDVLSHYGETAEFVVRPLGYVLLVSALENDSLNPGRIELLAKVYEKAGLDFEKEFGVTLPLLSMGMSGDFANAVSHGSTIVRIGTAIFGRR